MEKFTIFVEKIETTKQHSAAEVVQNAWQNKPSHQSMYEFYHMMRLEGYDEDVILNNIPK